MTLEQRLQNYRPARPPQVQRNGASYRATRRFCARGLRLCVNLYGRARAQDQTTRLIRDVMDFLLRRYHNYAIRENIGAHYRQRGLTTQEPVEFEHVIPASQLRDLVLLGLITVDEALDAPTCRLARAQHARLRELGLGSHTPDVYWFWRRYLALNIEIETHQGQVVDLHTWNLSQHYAVFARNQQSASTRI